jgi:hypothetical protein
MRHDRNQRFAMKKQGIYACYNPSKEKKRESWIN